MKIVAVVPTYNEKNNVEELVKKIFAQNILGLSVIFVDDNSPDGTGDIIKKLSLDFPIELFSRQEKSGLGKAYRAGFKKALSNGADFIFTMDADLSHNPEDMKKMIDAAIQKHDLIIGSRRIKGGHIIGWNLRRHIMSRGAMWFARFFLSLKTRDVTSGFRLYNRNMLEQIPWENIRSDGYAWQEEILYLAEKNNHSVVEVPVIFNDRQRGQSKLNHRDILEFFKTIKRLRDSKIERFKD